MENITHYPEKKCFILDFDSNEAVLEYRFIDTATVDFSRTFVPESFRGQGLAEKLVRHGLAWARDQHYNVVATCWYVDKFLS